MRYRSIAVFVAIAFVLAVAGSAAAVQGVQQRYQGPTKSPRYDARKLALLGKRLYQDVDLSFYQTQSCKSCHHPGAGFADPDNVNDPVNSFVSLGADGVSQGTRNAPTSAYAGFSPKLSKATGEYVGGLFWDGRATGLILGDPLAEQAQGPPLNPGEMAMPDKAAVIQAIRESNYARLFRTVFGATSLDDVDAAYDNMGRAIAAFERTKAVTHFSSRFDQFWRACQKAGIHLTLIGKTGGPTVESLPAGVLSATELNGLVLFNTRGNCSACHSLASPDAAGKTPPLFTDFTYDNLGIPANPGITWATGPDLGLGGFLKADAESTTPLFGDADYGLQNGKFRAPTLRNVALTPPYGHNGNFPTLQMIVDFYNTASDGSLWPAPEVPENVNRTELGNLGMSPEQVQDIVAFLGSLSDACKD